MPADIVIRGGSLVDGTGLFANQPASNGPGGLVYLSDHTGVGADLSCRKG